MKSARRLLSIVVVGLLVLGYLGSQYSALTGATASYAARIDIPQVKLLSLLLFVTAIVLALIPDREADPE